MHQHTTPKAMIYGVMMMAMAQLFWPYAAYAERYELVSPPICKNNLSEQVIFESHDNDRGRFAAGMARRDGEGGLWCIGLISSLRLPACSILLICMNVRIIRQAI